MRREKQYLADIVEAADAITKFISGFTEAAFLESDLVQSAVLQKLMIIGEASARVPAGLKSRHTHIPWANLIGLRNIAAHAYFSMRWLTVWTIATEQLPALRQQIANILAAELAE